MSSLLRVENTQIPYELNRSMSELFGFSEDQKTSSDQTAIYGNNDLFQNWKRDATPIVCEALASRNNAPHFFQKIVMALGQERGRIAQEMGTQDAEKFGVHRSDPRFNESCTLTHLTAPRYLRFNQKVRTQFLEFFPLFKEGIDKCDFETPFSRYKIEKIDSRKLQNLIATIKAFPIAKNREERDTQNHLIHLLNSLCGVQELIHVLFPQLNIPPFPEASPLQFFVGTAETKVDGQWKLMTRHITWIHQNETGPIQDAALELYNRIGFATLIHTPRESIDFHLQALEKLTKKLVTKSYDNPNEFKRDLAVWEYRFFHTMPFLRGSAAISEIIRDAICEIQNQPSPKTMDLDAMTEPFLESYLKMPRY